MENKLIANRVVNICNKLLLAKGEKTDTSLPELTAEEWNNVFMFASQQGMGTVIAQLFHDSHIENESIRKVLVKWYMQAERKRQDYLLRLKTMQELTKMFADAEIDIMFMKGATLAQLYPQPEWRVFSDIDYYLYGKSQSGIKVMAEKGIENSAYYHHHTQASLHGILLENHYDFVERINHRCDIILDDALKELAEKEGKNIKADFLGDNIHNAYIMTPTMNAIFLMRHMSAHFVSETIPLKMLYDWALFLKCHAKAVDWSFVKRLYIQSGMQAFAGIIQTILRLHLDYECEDCPIDFGQHRDVEKVWKSIICIPNKNPYKKFSLKYYYFETKTFFANRWKHKIVYPGESYAMLFFKYTWSGIKKMTGMLKIQD